MKKTSLFITLVLVLTLLFTACKSSTSNTGSERVETPTTTAEATTVKADAETMVIYFSQTGTTKNVAEKLAKLTNAGLYEITAEEPYTEEDIDYDNDECRAAQEQDDLSVRPAISSAKLDLSGVKTIYLGYPIWFGQAPRILDTFVESYNFEGITIIPFCTSGSSPLGSSAERLEDLADSGNWQDGRRFSSATSSDDLQDWLDELE